MGLHAPQIRHGREDERDGGGDPIDRHTVAHRAALAQASTFVADGGICRHVRMGRQCDLGDVQECCWPALCCCCRPQRRRLPIAARVREAPPSCITALPLSCTRAARPPIRMATHASEHVCARRDAACALASGTRVDSSGLVDTVSRFRLNGRYLAYVHESHDFRYMSGSIRVTVVDLRSGRQHSAGCRLASPSVGIDDPLTVTHLVLTAGGTAAWQETARPTPSAPVSDYVSKLDRRGSPPNARAAAHHRRPSAQPRQDRSLDERRSPTQHPPGTVTSPLCGRGVIVLPIGRSPIQEHFPRLRLAGDVDCDCHAPRIRIPIRLRARCALVRHAPLPDVRRLDRRARRRLDAGIDARNPEDQALSASMWSRSGGLVWVSLVWVG